MKLGPERLHQSGVTTSEKADAIFSGFDPLQGAVEVGITRHLLHTGKLPSAKEITRIMEIEEKAMLEFLDIGL